MSKTYRYAQVINGQKHEFAIHSATCRDLVKIKKNPMLGDVHEDNATSAQALVAAEVAIYQEQDQGWDTENFHIHRCCKNAPEVTA